MKQTTTAKILMLTICTVLGMQGTAQWLEMKEMPTPRAMATASVLDGKIYVMGGTFSQTSLATSTVEIYDPATDTWDTNTVPDLPIPLCGAASGVLSGSIYVIGGQTSYLGDNLKTVFKYTPGGEWTSVADLPAERSWLAATVFDGKIYAMGGAGTGLPNDTLMMYDPDINEWTILENMLSPRAFLSSEVLDGKIYAMGGMYLGVPRAEVEIYDPSSDTWSPGLNLPQERFWFGSGVINRELYVFGGVTANNASLENVLKYSPTANNWDNAGLEDISENHATFASAVVQDENCKQCLYAIGGTTSDFWQGGAGPLVSDVVLKYCPPQQTEIYEGPVSGTWRAGCSPYMIHGDISVPDGETLIIEPGVEVIFADHYQFNIEGQLLAIGTEDAIIAFRGMDEETNWNGLRFVDIPTTNDTSKLIYCKVQDGFPQGDTVTTKSGGGIYIESVDKLQISFCEITGNRTEGDIWTGGGGIAIVGSSPLVTNNLITNNVVAGGHGGGMSIVYGSYPVVVNNIFYNNTAFGGGALVVHECEPVLINNTFTGNHADHGGAVDCVEGAPSLVNSIFYHNSADLVGNVIHMKGAGLSTNFLYCDVEEGIAGFSQVHQPGAPDYNGRYENNIEIDPEFVDKLGDFHLMSSSPCIDAGANQVIIDLALYEAPSTDFEGTPRPDAAISDIGAYEFWVVGTEEMTEAYLSLRIHPNPFLSNTRIKYELKKASEVSIRIFDLAGKEVARIAEGFQSVGEHEVDWNAENLSAGVYFVRLQTEAHAQTTKCILQN